MSLVAAGAATAAKPAALLDSEFAVKRSELQRKFMVKEKILGILFADFAALILV